MPGVLGPECGIFRRLFSKGPGDERKGHVHPGRYTRRCENVAVFDPSSIMLPKHSRSMRGYPVEVHLVGCSFPSVQYSRLCKQRSARADRCDELRLPGSMSEPFNHRTIVDFPPCPLSAWNKDRIVGNAVAKLIFRQALGALNTGDCAACFGNHAELKQFRMHSQHLNGTENVQYLEVREQNDTNGHVHLKQPQFGGWYGLMLTTTSNSPGWPCIRHEAGATFRQRLRATRTGGITGSGPASVRARPRRSS